MAAKCNKSFDTNIRSSLYILCQHICGFFLPTNYISILKHSILNCHTVQDTYLLRVRVRNKDSSMLIRFLNFTPGVTSLSKWAMFFRLFIFIFYSFFLCLCTKNSNHLLFSLLFFPNVPGLCLFQGL